MPKRSCRTPSCAPTARSARCRPSSEPSCAFSRGCTRSRSTSRATACAASARRTLRSTLSPIPTRILRESNEGPPQPETIVEQNTEVALVERALLQLPMHLRAAATLRFIEGRSHPEIAEILHQPIGTVKSHVHRAVRILRRILGPQIGRFATEGVPLHALS